MSLARAQAGRGPAIVAAVVSALFLVLAWRQSGKPLQLDSVDLPYVARSIAAGDGPRLDRGLQAEPWTGLFFSPLLAYLLGGAFELFGSTARTAQLLGAAATVAAAITTVGTVRNLLGERAGRNACLAFPALYLLQPYTLQTSAVPAPDTVLAVPLFAGLLLSVVRLAWRAGAPRTDAPSALEQAAPAVLLTLLFWTGPAQAFVGLLAGVVLLPCWGWSRSARFWGVTILAAAEAYVVSSIAFELASGTSVTEAAAGFRRAIEGVPRCFAFDGGVIRSLAANGAVSVPFHLRWTGLLPWVALAFVAVEPRHLGPEREAATRTLRCLVALLLASTAFALGCTKGSYATVPFLPIAPFHALAMLPVALLAAPREGNPPSGRVILLAATAAGFGFFLVGALVVKEQILWHGNVTGATLYPQALALVLPGLLAAVALGAARRCRGPVPGQLLVVAIVSHLGAQSGIALAQSGATHSTSFNYGQTGLAEVVSYLRREAGPEDGILCMKDVAYALERPFWDSFPAFSSEEGERETLRLLERKPIRFAVFTTRFGQDVLAGKPELEQWLLKHSRSSRSFGDYRVFELPRPDPQASGAPRAATPGVG